MAISQSDSGRSRFERDSRRSTIESSRTQTVLPTLGCQTTGFERDGAFFSAIRQDSVLRKIKLIVEPWDIGDGAIRRGGAMTGRWHILRDLQHRRR